MDSSPFDYLFFTEKQNEIIIGTNETNKKNGIKEGYSAPEHLVIPSHYNGKEITQIGRWAFYSCHTIQTVKIFAPIQIINEYAFAECYNLSSINIPNTCMYIMWAAIDGRVQTTPSPQYGMGPITITFEPGSQLAYLDHSSIANFPSFIVYIYDKIYPSVHDESFVFKSDNNTNFSSYSVHIYSPYSFKFANIQTTMIQYSTCHNQISSLNTRSLALFAIFLMSKY